MPHTPVVNVQTPKLLALSATGQKPTGGSLLTTAGSPSIEPPGHEIIGQNEL